MPVGRPPLYDKAEDMQIIIDDYMLSVTFIHPETNQEICRPTMSGLAIALGMDRRSLVNYKNKEEFFPTIKKARAKVEQALEKHLYSNSVAGVIFNLKNNFEWKDKTERVHSGSIGLHELSPEELQAKIRDLENKRIQSLDD